MKSKKNKQTQQDKPNLYGFHAVREAWLNPDRHVQALYLTPQAERGFEETWAEGKDKNLKRPAPLSIDKHKLEKLLPHGAVHQGIAMACSPLPEHDIQDFIIKAEQQGNTLLAILDQVTDPHNIGAILRSASAFGLDGIIMQKKHAPVMDGVLAKTACGAVEHIPVAYVTNLSRSIEDFQQSGFFVIGLDERGENTVGDIPQSDKMIITLGSEGSGLRRLIKENCDQLVRLPTRPPIASLNVSNAAAVCFYALKNG